MKVQTRNQTMMLVLLGYPVTTLVGQSVLSHGPSTSSLLLFDDWGEVCGQRPETNFITVPIGQGEAAGTLSS